MAGVNKVTLIGNLGADVELKYAPNGNAMANISVATSEEWKDKATGQKQERVEWHNVCIYGPLAEIAAKYLKRGSQVYLEGKNQTRKYQDAQGQDRFITEVIVSGFDGKMQMLGGGGQRQEGNTSNAQPAQQNGVNNSPVAQNNMNGQQSAPPAYSVPPMNPNDFQAEGDDPF